MLEAAYFIRPSSESKGFMVRKILGRDLKTTRGVLMVRNPSARPSQLALGDDLAREYGTAPRRTFAFHDADRALFRHGPDKSLLLPLILEIPPPGVPRTLVPAIDN